MIIDDSRPSSRGVFAFMEPFDKALMAAGSVCSVILAICYPLFNTLMTSLMHKMLVITSKSEFQSEVNLLCLYLVCLGVVEFVVGTKSHVGP